jgi:hypothetical protein
MALITPAKSHPEVIIQAVAARDLKRAQDYANKHHIPTVHPSYQAVLDDPSINCVYIPLPNGLHFEWAVRAVRAGKHVLLEKPSVSNAAEAAALFSLEEVRSGKVVVLEAAHYRFAPTWRFFMGLVKGESQGGAAMETVEVSTKLPSLLPETDIRYNYDLAGGILMDLGTYAISAMRQVAGDPAECLECDMKTLDPPKENVDYASTAKWRMENGATAYTHVSMRTPMSHVKSLIPTVAVTFKPVKVEDPSLPAGQTKQRARTLRLNNFLIAGFWHRVDIEDKFTVTATDGKMVKTWMERESKKAYKLSDVGLEGVGEDYWFNYRHQLEQFVNRVMGRPTEHWIDGDDSVRQMKAIDMAYEKAGLGPRPSSKYFAEGF